MKKQRRQYTPEEKVAILRRHLLEKEPISKLCDEVALQPTPSLGTDLLGIAGPLRLRSERTDRYPISGTAPDSGSPAMARTFLLLTEGRRDTLA